MIYNVEHKSWNTTAVQWTGDNLSEIIEFTGSKILNDNDKVTLTTRIIYYKKDCSLALVNPFGDSPFYLTIGDWLIKTREGNIGPCTDKDFDRDFNLVKDTKQITVNEEKLKKALTKVLSDRLNKHKINEAITCLNFLKEESINDIACLKNSVTTKTLYQLYFTNFDVIEDVLKSLASCCEEE